MNASNSRDELGLNIDEAEWQWLRPHMERGAIITVAATIDLAEAGERIAADDARQIEEWLGSGALAKPTPAELARWENEPAKKFLILIISPFVLIQEIGIIN
jgi:hypothetical protein